MVGTRTWGGGVGIRGDKPLGDAWIIEGHGIDPDVTLDLGDLAPAPPITPRPLQPLP